MKEKMLALLTSYLESQEVTTPDAAEQYRAKEEVIADLTVFIQSQEDL